VIDVVKMPITIGIIARPDLVGLIPLTTCR